MRKAMMRLAATAMLVSTVALWAAPARAADDATADRDQQVADILQGNPGAKRISETSVLLAPGVLVTVPGPVTPGATMTVTKEDGTDTTVAVTDSTSDCTYQWLCVWEDIYRGGHRLMFFNCGMFDLNDYWNIHGGYARKWRDTISSIWNDQEAPATSVFYDYKFGAYHDVLHLTAGNYLQDLTRDPAERDGGNLNDRIDKIQSCGTPPRNP